ncbi:hypothetical protein [uncultured Kordia sp.]|uniref:hypothetical protein n=1 Tax=uncultured Kordia sp. TaxID=507699 RepID=UPI0026283916|nr:hypothetical protein [uncultured Kordia sp.]
MSNLVHIYGNINADGTIHSSSGDFKVVNEGGGFYKVTFDDSFKTIPTAVAAQNFREWDDFRYESGSPLDNTVLVALDKSKFKVLTGGNNNRASRNFTFIAIGMR